MIRHAPKVAALVAYEEGLLSEAGRARLEGHLRRCEACRQALGAMRAYDRLVAQARDEAPPALDFERMELSLRREARAQSRLIAQERGVGRGALGALLLAAAAIALVWVPAGPPVAVPGPTPDTTTAAPPPPRDASHAGEVTATVGAARLGSLAHGHTPAMVGAPVHPGSDLETSSRAQVHVRFAEGTGIALHSDTLVTVARLGGDATRLDLAHGTVSSAVAPLGPAGAYEVRAGAWAARVWGTRFAVRSAAGELEVAVQEGVVEVLRLGRRVQILRAPASFTSHGGPGLQPQDVIVPNALEPEALQWPVLRATEAPGVDEWVVSGRSLPASGVLAMRAPEGLAQIEGRLAGALVLRRSVPVSGHGAFLEPEPMRPGAPRLSGGTLAAERIAPVVQSGQRRLRQCMERADRAGTYVGGRFTLRLSIGLMGDVTRATLVAPGAAPPADFVACVEEQARSWIFPPPTGGPVAVDVPLRFSSR